MATTMLADYDDIDVDGDSATDNEVDDGALSTAKQVAHARNHGNFDLGATDDFFEGGGKIFKNDDSFCARVIELMLELARRVERINIDDDVTCSQHCRNRDRVLQDVRHH